MKRLFSYCMILMLSAIVSVKAVAQSANNGTDAKKNAKPVFHKDVASNGLEDSSIISNDAEQSTTIMEVFPNPSTGMLTVKTACAGKLFFYNQRGKEKASCIVNEGANPIFLQQVLFPGTYLCKFEGVNGSTAEVKVTYKL